MQFREEPGQTDTFLNDSILLVNIKVKGHLYKEEN